MAFIVPAFPFRECDLYQVRFRILSKTSYTKSSSSSTWTKKTTYENTDNSWEKEVNAIYNKGFTESTYTYAVNVHCYNTCTSTMESCGELYDDTCWPRYDQEFSFKAIRHPTSNDVIKVQVKPGQGNLGRCAAEYISVTNSSYGSCTVRFEGSGCPAGQCNEMHWTKVEINSRGKATTTTQNKLNHLGNTKTSYKAPQNGTSCMLTVGAKCEELTTTKSSTLC